MARDQNFGSSTKTETTLNLPDWQQNQWGALFNRLGSQNYNPYTGQRVADPNANQLAAWNQAGMIGGLGQDQLNAATSAAMQAAGYSPQQVQAQQIQAASAGPFQGASAGRVGPVQQVNAQNVNTANTASDTAGIYGGLRGNVRDVSAGQFGNLSPYMNQYNSQVVDSALGDVERARQMAVNSTGDAAAAAGAFGGSRHGIAEGVTNEAYARESARTAADLRARGFDTAAALQQQDLNRSLQAQGMNQGADAGLLGQAFGTTNQNALANQSANLQAGMANQSANLAQGQTNAQLATQASIANMQGRTQNNQFNANLAQNAALANQGANLQAGMANQNAGLVANGQTIQGAGLLGNLGAQAQNMGINGMNALGWAGGQQFGIEQAGLDADYEGYLNKQGWEQQHNQDWTAALGSMPALVGQTTNQTTTGFQSEKPDRWGQAIGAGTALYGFGQDQGWWGGGGQNGGNGFGPGGFTGGTNLGPQYGGPGSQFGQQSVPGGFNISQQPGGAQTYNSAGPQGGQSLFTGGGMNSTAPQGGGMIGGGQFGSPAVGGGQQFFVGGGMNAVQPAPAASQPQLSSNPLLAKWGYTDEQYANALRSGGAAQHAGWDQATADAMANNWMSRYGG